MTSEDRSLLRKAATDPKGQVAIKRAQQTWHPDRDRLDTLARCGHLLPLGERMGPHLGGTFALWQITAAGRAVAEPGGRRRGSGLILLYDFSYLGEASPDGGTYNCGRHQFRTGSLLPLSVSLVDVGKPAGAMFCRSPTYSGRGLKSCVAPCRSDD